MVPDLCELTVKVADAPTTQAREMKSSVATARIGGVHSSEGRAYCTDWAVSRAIHSLCYDLLDAHDLPSALMDDLVRDWEMCQPRYGGFVPRAVAILDRTLRLLRRVEAHPDRLLLTTLLEDACDSIDPDAVWRALAAADLLAV